LGIGYLYVLVVQKLLIIDHQNRNILKIGIDIFFRKWIHSIQ
jgi:hypothetical protein